MREKILLEFISLASKSGNKYPISEKTLISAFENLGINPNLINLYFENSVSSLLEFFVKYHNNIIEKQIESVDIGTNIRSKIIEATKIAITADAENLNFIRQILIYCSCPKNTYLLPKLLYIRCDMIWHKIGDKSTDFNFYTKRGILSVIYSRILKKLVDGKDEREIWRDLEKSVDIIGKIGIKKHEIKELIKEKIDIDNIKASLTNLPFFRLFY